MDFSHLPVWLWQLYWILFTAFDANGMGWLLAQATAQGIIIGIATGLGLAVVLRKD